MMTDYEKQIYDKLPEIAFVNSDGRIRMIRRGVQKLFDMPGHLAGIEGLTADDLNIKAGVNRAQREAMISMVLFGLGSPYSDPDSYDSSGVGRLS